LPAVHRVASLLKRWLLGTHQGGVAEQHVDAYLDEFVFRFNRRTSRGAACSSTACSNSPSGAADHLRDDVWSRRGQASTVRGRARSRLR
jgi:ISXO2-like transposase domain